MTQTNAPEPITLRCYAHEDQDTTNGLCQKCLTETDSLTRIVRHNIAMRGFLLRLLHPEDLGYAATPYIRDEARKLLGLVPVEFDYEAALKAART